MQTITLEPTSLTIKVGEIVLGELDGLPVMVFHIPRHAEPELVWVVTRSVADEIRRAAEAFCNGDYLKVEADAGLTPEDE